MVHPYTPLVLSATLTEYCTTYKGEIFTPLLGAITHPLVHLRTLFFRYTGTEAPETSENFCFIISTHKILYWGPQCYLRNRDNRPIADSETVSLALRWWTRNFPMCFCTWAWLAGFAPCSSQHTVITFYKGNNYSPMKTQTSRKHDNTNVTCYTIRDYTENKLSTRKAVHPPEG